jgi:hypothetical protein
MLDHTLQAQGAACSSELRSGLEGTPLCPVSWRRHFSALSPSPAIQVSGTSSLTTREVPIYGVDTDVLCLSCRRFRPTPRRRLSGLSHPSPIPGPLALSVQQLSTLSLPGGKFGVLETVQPFPVEKSQGSRHNDEGLGPQIPAVLLQ